VASMFVNRPMPIMVVATLSGGVACAGSMSSAAVTSATTAAIVRWCRGRVCGGGALLLLSAQVDGGLAWRRLVRQASLNRLPSINWRGVGDGLAARWAVAAQQPCAGGLLLSFGDVLGGQRLTQPAC
jgi:hypothetical protein